jgi:hypothetical protein
LDLHVPLRKIAFFDALIQIALVALPILTDDRLGLFVGENLDTLLGLQMELNPEPIVLGVDQAKGVAAVTVHVAVGVWDAPGAIIGSSPGAISFNK